MKDAPFGNFDVALNAANDYNRLLAENAALVDRHDRIVARLRLRVERLEQVAEAARRVINPRNVERDAAHRYTLHVRESDYDEALAALDSADSQSSEVKE